MKEWATATGWQSVAFVGYMGLNVSRLPSNTCFSVAISGPLNVKADIKLSQLANDNEFLLNGSHVLDHSSSRILNAWEANVCSLPKLKISLTSSEFSTGGIGGSASAAAAVTLALNELTGSRASLSTLERIAAYGSGSAARGLTAGLVRWDECSGRIERLSKPGAFAGLNVLVAVTHFAPKPLKSEEIHCAARMSRHFVSRSRLIRRLLSPIACDARDVQNISRLGRVAEIDTLQMHRCISTGQPPINLIDSNLKQFLRDFIGFRKKAKVESYYRLNYGRNVFFIHDSKYSGEVSYWLSGHPHVKRTIPMVAAGDA